MKPHQEVAVAFARALVDGDFERARQLLSPSLQSTFTPARLREKLYAMLRYADGGPGRIVFEEEFSGDEWSAKQPGDVGWSYVGILGDDYVEAVTVTVADVGGELLIRDVEWGRP